MWIHSFGLVYFPARCSRGEEEPLSSSLWRDTRHPAAPETSSTGESCCLSSWDHRLVNFCETAKCWFGSLSSITEASHRPWCLDYRIKAFQFSSRWKNSWSKAFFLPADGEQWNPVHRFSRWTFPFHGFCSALSFFVNLNILTQTGGFTCQRNSRLLLGTNSVACSSAVTII